MKLEMSVVSHTRHWSIMPCVQVHCPLSCWNMKLSPDISLMHGNILLLQQYFTIIVAVRFHSRLHNFIFQQDSAPAHRARDTIALLRQEMPDFISPDQWPTNSPDMNPVGCNATAGLRETRKWRRRAVSAPVECVAQHWTKHHRRSNRSVAYATHHLCMSKRRSFWAPDVK